tara:strand:+ start:2368 stop:2541 length:174 start_codon:yes stop_codon:yes gene_type:complete
MAKEVKETTISVNLNYQGLEFTLSQTASNYALEEALDALANQVKILSATDGGLEDPE